MPNINSQKNLSFLIKNLKRFNTLELVGVFLGDGSIIYNPPKIYKFELNGNADDEQDYYSKISIFLKRKFDLNPKVYIKYEKLGKTLRLVVNNKNFVYFLIKNLKLNFRNKTFEGYIPEDFLKWNKSKHILRGLFETDGCLYFTRTKPTNLANYPRLEIKTSSKKLANQVVYLLKQRKFRVNTRTSKGDKTIGIYLSGNKMVEKWINEIGFSKLKTITKHQIYKRLGYYLPRSSLSKRLNILKGT